MVTILKIKSQNEKEALKIIPVTGSERGHISRKPGHRINLTNSVFKNPPNSGKKKKKKSNQLFSVCLVSCFAIAYQL